MLTLVADLTPFVLGALFVGWGGGTLLTGLDDERVSRFALNHLIRDVRRTVVAVRAAAITTGIVGVGLLVAPTARQPAIGGALIGLGLVAYAGYAVVTELEPAPWRRYIRAALVGVGGLLATGAQHAWWTTMADRPVAAPAILAATVAGLAALWIYRRPRRPRLRVAASAASTENEPPLHRLAG